MAWKTAILTASDKGARGEREDTSAQVIRELVEEELGGEIIEYRIVPDEQDEIIAALIELTDYFQADLVLTTGGTDLAIRDVTPEATRRVIERRCPASLRPCAVPSCRRTARLCCSAVFAAFAGER